MCVCVCVCVTLQPEKRLLRTASGRLLAAAERSASQSGIPSTGAAGADGSAPLGSPTAPAVPPNTTVTTRHSYSGSLSAIELVPTTTAATSQPLHTLQMPPQPLQQHVTDSEGAPSEDSLAGWAAATRNLASRASDESSAASGSIGRMGASPPRSALSAYAGAAAAGAARPASRLGAGSGGSTGATTSSAQQSLLNRFNHQRNRSQLPSMGEDVEGDGEAQPATAATDAAGPAAPPPPAVASSDRPSGGSHDGGVVRTTPVGSGGNIARGERVTPTQGSQLTVELLQAAGERPSMLRGDRFEKDSVLMGT